MVKKFIYPLLLCLSFLTSLIVQAQKSYINVKITGAFSQEYTFNNDIIQRELIAQKIIDPKKTLGFFVNRNPSVPFYFSCVLVNLVDTTFAAGVFPVIRIVNDIPALTSNTIKGGFISIKINNKDIARPDEYISVPGNLNEIIIKQIKGSDVKGTFNTVMYCISDTSKQIQVKGSFELYK